MDHDFLDELETDRASIVSSPRRTLAPVWGESFDINVPSRVAAKFDVEVFDHNKLETAKSLGAGLINLADLEPFESVEKKISLVSSKDGAKGWVRVVRPPQHYLAPTQTGWILG